MLSSNNFYNTLYQREESRFARGAQFAHGVQKKAAAPHSYGAAELFRTEEEKAERADNGGRKRGKQSLLDDAEAAGKESGAVPKTETESRIIVKPDGTRVLVITTRCGQNVRVKSLKLSDPTDMENEGKQEGVKGENMEEKLNDYSDNGGISYGQDSACSETA